MKIEIFSRRGLLGRRYYFRIRAKNGEPIAHSEAYQNRGDCSAIAYTMREQLFDADLVTLS